MSNIDVTKPVYGNPTTQSVRDNFAAAKTEIDALQAFQGTGPFLPLAGGTMIGPITLGADPANDLHAATKRYVDNAVGPINANFANYLPLAGGTLTGALIGTALTLSGALNGTTITTTGAITSAGNISGNAMIIGTNTTTNSIINFDSQTGGGGLRAIRFRSGNTAAGLRWTAQVLANAEAGSDVGSDFNLTRYSDTGTSLGTSIAIVRSSGAITISGATKLVNGLSMWNAVTPSAKPTVTGSRGGNAALTSALIALASYGFFVDSSTA